MNNHVFDADKLSERILGQTWPNLGTQMAENDSKLAPQNDPKSIENRSRKMIEMLIDFGAILGRRWRPKNDQERSKNAPKSGPRTPQERPRAALERPRPAKSDPRAAQERPSASQEPPRAAKATKSPRRAAKIAPKAPQRTGTIGVFLWFYKGSVKVMFWKHLALGALLAALGACA